ncbi:MAG: thiamine biosynthesis protein [Leptospirillum sp.]
MRGLLLLSGGLDSSLAGHVLREMDVDLVALHLESPFGCDNTAEQMARELGIPLITRPKGERFIEVLKKPEFGYGSVWNPCVDCRILMFALGREVMDETGAAFLVTGEVVGQRPLSQKKGTLSLIDREAGMEGRVLRPLSARLLPETLPEQNGWVDRNRLHSLSGRSRKPQLEMARKAGFSHIPSPAGGCLLTDDNFRDRVGDFIQLDLDSGKAPLLRYGRHYRFDETWVIVGRDARDNDWLEESIRGQGIGFSPDGFSGPAVFFPDPIPSDVEAITAAAIRLFGKRVPDGALPLKAILGDETYPVSFSAPEQESVWLDPAHWSAHWRH